MPGQRSGAGGQPAGNAGTRLGRALVRPHQGARRAHGGAAQEARRPEPHRDRLRPRIPARGSEPDAVTRRILLILLAFTAVIIAGAMVPLALDASTHDQTSFI